MRLVDAEASIMPGIDVGKCGARPRQIAVKKCESTDASTFFETLNYLGECTHEREREKYTTINATIAVKSCRLWPFPFVLDGEPHDIWCSTLLSWEGGNKIFFESFHSP